MNFNVWKTFSLEDLTSNEALNLTLERDEVLVNVRSPLAIFYFITSRISDENNSSRYESGLIESHGNLVEQYKLCKRYIWELNNKLASDQSNCKAYHLCLVGLANERLEEIAERIPKGFRLALALPDPRLN